MATPEPAARRRNSLVPWRAREEDERVPAALDELEPGFRVLHRVDTGYGEVDFFVAGPTGAFAIEIPAWTGEVHAKRGKLLCGFHDEERTRRRAIWSAACLEQWLDEDGVDIPVAALLVAADARVDGDRIDLPYLNVLPVASLTSFLQDGPNVLAQNRIERAVQAIAAHAATAAAAS
jgi:Nuclease-related domain